jgi:hypothetical protein
LFYSFDDFTEFYIGHVDVAMIDYSFQNFCKLCSSTYKINYLLGHSRLTDLEPTETKDILMSRYSSGPKDNSRKMLFDAKTSIDAMHQVINYSQAEL